jgi:hypothetical protein
MPCHTVGCKTVKKLVEDLKDRKCLAFDLPVFEMQNDLNVYIRRSDRDEQLVLEHAQVTEKVSAENVRRIEDYLSL